MTLSTEKKAELRELFERKKELDEVERQLRVDMQAWNERVFEITGSDKTKPLNLNDLMLMVL